MTGRAREVLDIIGRLTVSGDMITNSRITAKTSMSRQHVRKEILRLTGLGLIDIQTDDVGRVAVINLTAEGYDELGMTPAPGDPTFPILGEVAAGQPTITSDQILGHAGQLAELFRMREGDFLLKVRGESMSGIGIQSGDLVAIRAGQKEPAGGTITLVCIPGENTATLKRWHRLGRRVTLTSENPSVGPLSFDAEDVEIQGYLLGYVGMRH